MHFPKARAADLITEQVGDELVVYDGESSEAHCLNALASAVFVAADGQTSPGDLAAIASKQLNETIDVPAVEAALTELEERGLVETESGGVSRRGFMKRSAAVGGVALAGTMVTSVLTPAYGMAASLPTALPTGYSSVAFEFSDGTTLYGAHFGAGQIPGSSPSWGSNPGNGPNCSITNSAIGSGSLAISTALTSGGIVVTVPAGVSLTEAAVWFGNGGTGACKGCIYGGTDNGNVVHSSPANQNLTVTQIDSTHWLIAFPASCY